MGLFDIFKKKEVIETKEPDNSEDVKDNVQKNTTSDCSELDSIIPDEYREYIKQAIDDYNSLSDKEFWEKYNLQEIWFTDEEFSEEKAEGNLGFVIVNLLVNKDYILQLDWKEDPADYLNDLPSCWDCEEKIVEFDLDNDQIYLAKVPKETEVKNLFEIGIKNFEVNA